MPVGTARSQGSMGDYIHHYVGARFRLNGSGVMRTTLYGQDDVTSTVLPTITMASANRFNSYINANVVEQRASLEMKTTAIDETFEVQRIILFTKPYATMLPA